MSLTVCCRDAPELARLRHGMGAKRGPHSPGCSRQQLGTGGKPALGLPDPKSPPDALWGIGLSPRPGVSAGPGSIWGGAVYIWVQVCGHVCACARGCECARVHVYVHACVHACTWVHIAVCVQLRECMGTCMCMCMRVCALVYVHACAQMCMCLHACVCMYVCAFICMGLCMHTRVCVRVCACMYMHTASICHGPVPASPAACSSPPWWVLAPWSRLSQQPPWLGSEPRGRLSPGDGGTGLVRLCRALNLQSSK